tara:strand:+ start:231 stop:485 length:255 start_codon:yes stop_codon:yes gene_type:complete
MAFLRKPLSGGWIPHFGHYANLVGIDHIGFGSDYYYGQDPYSSLEEAHQMYQERIDSGSWKPETYRPPPYIYPRGLRPPTSFQI